MSGEFTQREQTYGFKLFGCAANEFHLVSRDAALARNRS
jgi:hypothetical protein